MLHLDLKHVAACAAATSDNYYNAAVMGSFPAPCSTSAQPRLDQGQKHALLTRLSTLCEPFDRHGAAAVLLIDAEAAEKVLVLLHAAGAMEMRPENPVEPWALTREARSQVVAVCPQLSQDFRDARMWALIYTGEVIRQAESMFEILTPVQATLCYSLIMAKYIPHQPPIEMEVEGHEDEGTASSPSTPRHSMSGSGRMSCSGSSMASVS